MMKVRVGQSVSVEGIDYLVVGFSAESVLLRELETHRGLELSVREFLRAATDSPSSVIARHLGPGSLPSLTGRQRERAEFWLAALLDLEARVEAAASAGVSLRSVVIEKAAELTHSGHPTSIRTLYRRLERFRETGAASLVDGRLADPFVNRSRVDDRVVAALAEVMVQQRDESTGTRQRLIDQTCMLLRDRQDAEVVVTPSRATFFRLIDRMDRGRHVTGSAKTRRSLANRPDRGWVPSGAIRPGEQVQIDTTKLDVLIEVDGRPVRPELTILVDAATRSILAAIVRPGATKSVDLVVLLARALTPYERRPGNAVVSHSVMSGALSPALLGADEMDDYRARLPRIFPSTITTDRGAIFESQHFRMVCESLGVDLNVAAPYTPTDKPVVERTFKSINTRFVQYLAGYTGRGVEFRGSSTPAVLLSLQQLQELLDQWIAVDWQDRPHSGLRDPVFPSRTASPNQMARAAMELFPDVVLPLDEDSYLRLMPRQWRTVQYYGIRIDGRTYDSAALAPYRRLSSPYPEHGGKWPVRVDPYNVQTVWLELADQLIPLQWASPHATAPFSAEVWAAVRADQPNRDAATEARRSEHVEQIRRFGAKPTREERKVVAALSRDQAVRAVLPAVHSRMTAASQVLDEPEDVGETAPVVVLPRLRVLDNESWGD